jgi:hypothetical protein
VLEERFQRARSFHAGIDFFDLTLCQFFPPRANRFSLPQSVQKQLDFARCEAHVAGEPNQEHPILCIARIAALTIGAIGWWKKSEAFRSNGWRKL